jgi:hypothetical protein
MQQVVDLQEDPKFQALDVELLAISPDSADAWSSEGSKLRDHYAHAVRRREPRMAEVGRRRLDDDDVD